MCTLARQAASKAGGAGLQLLTFSWPSSYISYSHNVKIMSANIYRHDFAMSKPTWTSASTSIHTVRQAENNRSELAILRSVRSSQCFYCTSNLKYILVLEVYIYIYRLYLVKPKQQNLLGFKESRICSIRCNLWLWLKKNMILWNVSWCKDGSMSAKYRDVNQNSMSAMYRDVHQKRLRGKNAAAAAAYARVSSVFFIPSVRNGAA